MSDPSEDVDPEPQAEAVDIDDPFDVPEDVEDAWDDDDVAEGEAPSG